MKKVKIYSDGGSRGNPGPSACAFVALEKDSEVFSQAKFLGIATNNQAEYQGVLLAVDWLLENGYKSVDFILDSELVVKQLTQVYRIKDATLQKFAQTIWERLKKNNIVATFSHVLRESNKKADELLNQVLDGNF